ncbi:MAG: PfkB family carbohydrate kinase [Patescibacteria group bacterium]
MRIALLGPVVKDKITVDRATTVQVGGIPYYAGVALKNLGADVTVFATYYSEDDAWVRKNFKYIEVVHIPAEQTIEFERVYSSENPDVCVSVVARYAKNRIEFSPELVRSLNSFNYVIFGPMFYNNISPHLFTAIHKGKIVLGNFGMFSYPKGESLVWKNPENLIHVAPHLSYLFLNDKEIMFVAQKKSIDEAARFMQTKTDAAIIVTLGSKGSVVFMNGGRYVISAFSPEKIIDPTGMGDTYLAAFIRATNLYSSSVSQGTFAAMAATMKLERRGAFNGNIENVLTRLAGSGILLK